MTGERNRSAVVVVVALALLSTTALAQPAAGVRRIGYLGPPVTSATEHFKQMFVDGLEQHGWVEGRNLVIERRYFEAADWRLPALATDLVRLKVELIVTLTTPAALAARRATASIPIVTVTGDAVGSGLAASYARPGGNVTGLTHIPSDDWLGKIVDLLKQAAPTARRVAVLGDSTNSSETRAAHGAEGAARARGLTLVPVELRSADAFDRAFADARRARIDALFAHDSPLNFAHRTRIVEFALRERLPTAFGNSAFVEAGGLLSYSPSLADQFRRATSYVDQILRGARPGDLPIERPQRFEMAVNAKTAHALQLTLPVSLLMRADMIVDR